VPDVQVSFNGGHQGRKDYPCKEIEKEDPRQICKEWHMRAKRNHYRIQ